MFKDIKKASTMLSSLPKAAIVESQWLPLAKQLRIGGSTRIDHGHRSPRTLQINNNLSSWSCYCYACNAGKVVYKDAVRLSEQVAPKEPQEAPQDLVELNKCDQYIIENVDIFLRSKGLSLDIVEESLGNENVCYSKEVNRLILRVGNQLNQLNQLHGRYLGNGNAPKWMHYSKHSFITLRQNREHSNSALITEDLFSAIKALYVVNLFDLDIDIICNLGTNISKFMLYHLRHYNNVMSAFDCDAAGYKATRELSKSVKLLYNIDLSVIDILKYTKEKADLKYMDIEDIKRSLSRGK